MSRLSLIFALFLLTALPACSAVQCRNQHAHTADVPPKCFQQRACADGQRHFVAFENCPN